MSGFVLIFQRNGEPVAAGLAAAMLTRIAHRGPDGSAAKTEAGIFIGCQHFWTTPEDVGARQPLISDDQRYLLAFDGRLDNRAQLLSALGLTHSEGKGLCDGTLLLTGYLRWQDAVWPRLLGPFACALYDRVEQRVVCARDPLGNRALCYYVNRQVLLVASEPYAIRAHPTVSGTLDEHTVAGLFTWTFPRDQTLFHDIREVHPGGLLTVDRQRVGSRHFWSPPEITQGKHTTDNEYAEEFRRLIGEAVRCRLRVHGKAAVKLSGGLDSSAVAALWAGEMHDAPSGIPTYSWVFDDFPDCDERAYIAQLSRHWGFDTHYANCDDAWTLGGEAGLAGNPNQPDLELFRGLQERLHARMAADGVRVALSGYGGDDLYLGDETWFASLIADQQWRSVQHVLKAAMQAREMRGLRASIQPRRLVRALGGHTPTLRWILPHRSSAFPAWLTPEACAILSTATDERNSSARSKRKTQWEGRRPHLFNPRLPWFSNLAAYFDAHSGLEERYPMRDRRLVEFMLTIPTHQLRRMQTSRFILRNALRPDWPDKIARRRDKTTLAPIAAAGIVTHERTTFLHLLQLGQPLWSRYVKPAWVAGAIESDNHGLGRGSELWVPWVCVALTLWLHTYHPSQLGPSMIYDSNRSLSK